MKSTLSAAVLGLLALVIPAEAAVYECTMSSRSRDNWVAPKMWIDMRETNVVKVYDGHVERSKGDAAYPVNYTMRGQTRYMMKWTLDGLQGTQDENTVDYSATFDRAAQTISVRARVRGYDNNAHGRGNCALLR